jgi:hypothetical protein
MASKNTTTKFDFSQLSDAELADSLGTNKAALDALEAKDKALKAEVKHRAPKGGSMLGAYFEIAATEQIAGRPDVDKLRFHLGDEYAAFEKPVVSYVVRVKPAPNVASMMNIAA